MNIVKTWQSGINGTGITICINDPSGVDFKHPEFNGRFNLNASFNFGTNKSDPSPDLSSSGNKEHGTLMAGLAGATEGNGNCGVGVSFKASLSGIMGTSRGWDHFEATARSLSYRNDINDIYSNSWGYIDFYQSNIAYMHKRIRKALRDNAEKGRKGRGNVIIFSAGNGGLFNGTCSYDEYISSIYTIGISVITGRHTPSLQNVKCAGISAVTYGRDGLDGVNNPEFRMPAPGLNGRCSSKAASSSASAAVASGILGLVLQANPNLHWRDVQHLIARCSNSNIGSVQWKKNGVGIKVSDDFGFGVLDAKALTDGAKQWKNVGPQMNCILSFSENTKIDGEATLNRKINISQTAACRGIRHLEHVLLVLNLNFTFRRQIEVTLTSPLGTTSIMLRSGRRFDGGKTIENLSLLSLHHWGENPNGLWELRIRNTLPNANQKGFLFNFALQLFGTHNDPMKDNTHVKPSTLHPTVDEESTTRTASSTHVLIISVTVPIALLILLLIIVLVKKKGLSMRSSTVTSTQPSFEDSVVQSR